jgi:leucyl aminopeptidase
MIELKTIDLTKTRTETIAIPICQDASIHVGAINLSLEKKAKEFPEFKGEKGQELILHDLPEVKPRRVIFIGLGEKAKLDTETMRSFGGKAVSKAIALEQNSLACIPPACDAVELTKQDLNETIMEGIFLSNHIFDVYKQKKKQTPLKRVIIHMSAGDRKKFAALPNRVAAVCRMTLQAREWVNTPSNDKRPEALARKIAALGRKAKLKVEVQGDKMLQQKKFGALLGVAQGSNSKARLVTMEYAAPGARQTIALVGKGVTFDSGGINLKPTSGLDTMKCDMAGAAAVAGAIIAIAQLKPKINVVALLPLVENMPSGNATRPGDILKSYAGKSVEIGNTDAEGRLILIDAMAYAIEKYNPDTLIDMATLTGACVVALGEKIAGVFSFDEKLARQIKACGDKVYERCWPMPMPEDYNRLLKSKIADLRNISSGRWGGAITAALFLSEFVGDTSWAHIDIAGPAFLDKASAYSSAGATGFGVRLLTELVQQIADR